MAGASTLGSRIETAEEVFERLPIFPRFTRLDISMKPLFAEFVKDDKITVSDISFTNLWGWDHLRSYELSNLNGNVIISATISGKKEILCPIGTNKLNESVLECFSYLESVGSEPKIRLCSEQVKEFITSPKIRAESDKRNADYLFLINDLVELRGKGYKTERNDLNNILKSHKVEYRVLTYDLIPQAIKFENDWYESRTGSETAVTNLTHEHKACLRVLESFSQLGVFGGVLIVDGEFKGFTIADVMSSNMVQAHFEKAERKLRGSYVALWWNLAKSIRQSFPQYELMNLEQDLGLAGLSSEKMQRQPFITLPKYTLRPA